MATRGIVLVTGAAGFVGRRVVADFAAAGWSVRAVVRRAQQESQQELPAPGVQWLALGDLSAQPDWPAALAGVDAVVHLAGRAHVMNDDAVDPLAEYRRVNVTATVALARAAADAGVRRFVFMSSVKAVAESSDGGGLPEDATPQPADPYGISKREAELALLAPGAFGAMSVVVLRPPLVYGPGVRANFARLMAWVARGLPLPFGAADNRRSLVYVGNLADAVRFAVDSPELAGKACFVTDGEDLSTAELIRRLAAAMRRMPRLLWVPTGLLRAALSALGRRAEADRLLGTLTLKADHLREAGWRPPFGVDEGLAETVASIQSGAIR